MGFIKAFTGSLSGTFADEWKEFYKPKENVGATVAIYEAVKQTTNAGRGENTKGYDNIITNGSKIVVPEGTALITVQDGAITGFVAEPGGFIYSSDDPNSKSFLSGGGILASTISSSWEKFKFGGQPGSEQLLFYVNLKEIPNNRFGTQSEIYWDDAYLNAQVGAITRGTYSLRIVDPLLFIKNFVPAKYLQPGSSSFDFADMDNEAGEQLFNEVVGSLSSAFANYANDPSKGNRMARIQGDQIGFAESMSQAVEDGYKWKSDRGLEIVKVAIQAIEYDEESRELLKQAQADDIEVRKATRMGQAYSNNMAGMMAAASASAMNTAAGNENGAMMGFMGMNIANMQANNLMGAATDAQQTQVASQPIQQNVQTQEDPYARLTELKKLLDAGVITQADFDAAKAKLLGI